MSGNISQTCFLSLSERNPLVALALCTLSSCTRSERAALIVAASYFVFAFLSSPHPSYPFLLYPFSLQLALLQCNLARFCTDNSSFALIASLHSLLPHHAPQLAFCCALLLLIDNLSLKLIKGLKRLL